MKRTVCMILIAVISLSLFSCRKDDMIGSNTSYVQHPDDGLKSDAIERSYEMSDIVDLLYGKIKNEMSTWDEDGIYAISFFIYSNEAYEYMDFTNVSTWAISYNTESDCPGAGPLDEERWNYAFWRQNETSIIGTYKYGEKPDEYTEALYKWYAEQGIENIGFEDIENMYDKGVYIGKGPVGHYELLRIAAEVAKRLQEEGFIKKQFKKAIPVIIHGLEYAWYDFEATKIANPNGEADQFIKAMEAMGFV